jgi:hypothetical protein
MANNSMQRTALRAAADAARSPRPSSHLHPSRLSAASNYGQLPIINKRGYPLDASAPYILLWPRPRSRYGVTAVAVACCMSR